MKHGDACPACRVYMVVEEGEYVCPSCGHAEPIRSVGDDLTQRAPEPRDAKVLFEKMRRAVGE